MRWEGAGREINRSQDLLPAKQMEGGERESGQLKEAPSPERRG